VVNGQTGEIIIPANKKITKTLLRKLADSYDSIEIDPSPIRNKILDIIQSFEQKFAMLDMERERSLDRSSPATKSIPVSSSRSRLRRQQAQALRR
jgi:DNA-directed RNA polymerase subunit beta